MARHKTIDAVCICALLVSIAVACSNVSAGPIDNADEFMQSQINLQTGEETDSPPAAPVIEWADGTPPADGSADAASTDPQGTSQ